MNYGFKNDFFFLIKKCGNKSPLLSQNLSFLETKKLHAMEL